MLQKKNVEALATPDDCLLAEEIAKADPGVQAMLQERNITSLDLVACDPWSGTHPFLPLPHLPTLSAQRINRRVLERELHCVLCIALIWTFRRFWPE